MRDAANKHRSPSFTKGLGMTYYTRTWVSPKSVPRTVPQKRAGRETRSLLPESGEDTTRGMVVDPVPLFPGDGPTALHCRHELVRPGGQPQLVDHPITGTGSRRER